MTSRPVRDIRSDAARVLERVELVGVHLMTSDYDSRFRSGEFQIFTAFAVDTRVDAGDSILHVWVRNQSWAIVEPDEGLPEDPNELSEEVINERLCWRATSEWIAEYAATEEGGIDDVDLEALTAFALTMGPPTVHPYARALLQSLTGKGPYPAFTLPHMQPLTAKGDDELVETE